MGKFEEVDIKKPGTWMCVPLRRAPAALCQIDAKYGKKTSLSRRRVSFPKFVSLFPSFRRKRTENSALRGKKRKISHSDTAQKIGEGGGRAWMDR